MLFNLYGLSRAGGERFNQAKLESPASKQAQSITDYFYGAASGGLLTNLLK